jgi:Tol biopolymer transport system component
LPTWRVRVSSCHSPHETALRARGEVLFAHPTVSTKLNPSLAFGRDVIDWAIRPDGTQVVYRADQDADGVFEIYAVDVAQPGVAVRVNDDLTAGGWVRAGFHYSSDGTHLVYRADQDVEDVTELYVVDMAMPGIAAQVNPELVGGGMVSTGYAFSPDGLSIAYVADQEVDSQLELYRVLVAQPGLATKLNEAPVDEGDLCRFEWSPDSARVAYCGDMATNDVHELFAVEVANPGVQTKLNPPLIAGGEVTPHFTFSADSQSVYYIATQESPDLRELYRVDIAAPLAATQLSAPLVAGGNVEFFALRPDHARIAYVADGKADGYYDLYEVDFATPETAVRMSPDAAGSGVYDFRYSPDGSTFVYAASQDDDYGDLYSVEVAGPGTTTRLNPQMAAEGEIWSFEFAQ